MTDPVRSMFAMSDDWMDGIHTILVILDSDGRIRMINGAALAVLGCEREAVLGRGFSQFFSDPASESVDSEDGVVHRIRWHRQALRDGEGTTVGTLYSGDDVTACLRAEDELRQSNQRLEAFLRVSQTISSSTDLSALMQVIVDSATRLMNIGSGAIYLSQDLETIRLEATSPPLPADFPDQFRVAPLEPHAHIRQTLVSGCYVLLADTATASLTPEEQEIVDIRNLRTTLYLPIRLRDRTIGVLILASVTDVYVFSDKEISLLQGFADHAAQVIDNLRLYEAACTHAAQLEAEISERKRAQAEIERLHEQFAQAQKMESVGRLAGGVAHDFNNMLSVILGHAEMAMRTLTPDDQLSMALGEIHSAAERSADLTRQLLAFARRQTIEPRVLDLNGTVEKTLRMLRPLLGEDIDLVWKPGTDVWPVRLDPAQMDQILANLCINARDAIANVGKITIETENTVFDSAYCAQHVEFVPGDYVRLTVSDNGCGMDAKVLSHLFEPFFTTKERGKGTGLGLATVYGAVRQNGGFVNVYSEPGCGTSFRVYLPRHQFENRPSVEADSPRQTSGGHETVLLVEDESAIRHIITIMLQELGYTVLVSASPQDAIRLCDTHAGDIELLLTDVVMPGMNGRDLSEALRVRRPGLCTLFMSGYTANVIAHHGVLDEGTHFLQKPFSMEALDKRLRRVLG